MSTDSAILSSNLFFLGVGVGAGLHLIQHLEVLNGVLVVLYDLANRFINSL